MQKNYYQILRIGNDASTQDIAYAYHRMQQRIKGSGIEDPDTLALLKEAHDTLADPASRTSYDQSLLTPEPAAKPGPQVEEPLVITYADEEDSSMRRMLVRAGIVIAIAALMIFVGLMLARRSAPPSVPQIAATANDTPSSNSTAPVSPAADSTQPVNTQKTADPKPRTADQIFSDVSASVVRVNVLDLNGNTIAGGSGVVIARSTVITNCHVALKGPQVMIRAAKQDFPANVEIADETFDLCQLSVGGGFSAPSVEIGNVKYVRPGQKVFAIGSPQGLDLTISEGIVSSLRETKLGPIIQTTAPISPGSSGGGLFNVSGQLIGITTFQAKTGQNLNFAVPADWIAEMTTREGSGPSLE